MTHLLVLEFSLIINIFCIYAIWIFFRTLFLILLAFNLRLTLCSYCNIEQDQSSKIFDCNLNLQTEIVSRNFKINEIIKSHQLIYFDDVKYLTIRDQTMHFMPTGIEIFLTRVTFLFIIRTQLKEIHEQNLKPFKNLNALQISENHIDYLEENLFKSSQNLKVLFLHKNRLRCIEPRVFDPLTKLKKIDLTDNFCINHKKEFITDITNARYFFDKFVYESCSKTVWFDEVLNLRKEIEENSKKIEYQTDEKNEKSLENFETKLNQTIEESLSSILHKNQILENKLTNLRQQIKTLQENFSSEISSNVTKNVENSGDIRISIETGIFLCLALLGILLVFMTSTCLIICCLKSGPKPKNQQTELTKVLLQYSSCWYERIF